MAWTIEYSETAGKQLQKLDKSVARRILGYLNERVAAQDNPRNLGKALSGPLGELWRYRVGDYRIICDIQDRTVTVLVVRIGHRSNIYK